ncbi:MAG TPA: hypothetical protein VHY08_11420, partial [Bacillota bacterium]|nr:hypothetical protein [Bacillota bacterium]
KLINVFLGLLLCLLFFAQIIFSEAKTIPYGPVKITLEPSSVLPSKNGAYAPENVLDNDPKTAWIEGQPGTDDINFTFHFSRSIEFLGFEYIPGYAKSKAIYAANVVPVRFSFVINSQETLVWPFVKWKLTGHDPEIDDKPAREPDANDPENYTYQYVLFKPTVTQSVTFIILGGMEAKYEDTGFSELHPIFRINGKTYCGRNSGAKILETLSKPDTAQFSPNIFVPIKDVSIDDVHVSWNNRISSKDVIRLKSGGLTNQQKSMFFPWGESFRWYETTKEIRVVSLVELGFSECDTAYGFVQRRIYLSKQNDALIFTRVEFQDELWK